MAFSFLPTLNAAQRQSHPKLQHLKSLVKSPGRGVSIGVGGMPHAGAAGIGIRPAGLGMAKGGMYADGDIVDGQGNYNIDYAINPSPVNPDPPYLAGYDPMSQGLGSQQDPLAGVPQNLPVQPSPGSIGGQPSLVASGHSPDYNSMMASAGSGNQGTTVQNADGTVTYTPPSAGGSSSGNGSGSGLSGWLQSKHGGISGANWLKAALTLATGTLSGLASKHAAQKSTITPQYNSGVAPTFKPIGVPLAFANGGQVAPPGPSMGLGSMPPYAYSNGGTCGGLASGGQMVGQIKGPGDGTSDSIPVNGGNAALSDGEFVLSAQDVADVGNGSNEAGAKILDQARQKLRIQRHGNPHLAKTVKPQHNPLLKPMMK